MPSYEKIGIFRALQLGDLLCSVPALRSVRNACPDAEITLIGLPWAAEFAGRFRHLLDRFLEFPGFPGLPEQKPRVRQLPDFLRDVQNERFDLLLQMHGSGRYSNSVAALFDARQSAGFAEAGSFRPDALSFIDYPHHLPEIKRNLALTESLGFPACGEHLEFPLTADDRRQFAAIAENHGLRRRDYICVHPGSRSSERRWPAEGFASVARELSGLGLKLVLTGSSDERIIAEIFQRNSNLEVVNLIGRTSLGSLGALMEGARLLVCNDTGVSHIAAALRVPSVILFTGSHAHRWAPLDRLIHRPVEAGAQTVSVKERVLDAVADLLAGGVSRCAAG